MALGRIELTAQLEGLREIREGISRIFPQTPVGRAARARVLANAIEKALLPAELRLRELTPLGPTGNLKRAVTSKVVEYAQDGNAVGILGYVRAGRERSASAAGGKVRAGPDRAFHQYWLEEGTKERTVTTPADKPYTRKSHKRTMKSGKVTQVQSHAVARQGGYIASSFNSLGGFDGFTPTPRPARGSGTPHRVQTKPGYPNAFFRKSKNPITIPAMPVGGSTGRPPLATAWNQTRPTVAEILTRELRISLEQALSAITTTGGNLS
jgi:hypothetical protein